MNKNRLFEQPRIYYIFYLLVLALYLSNQILKDESIYTSVMVLFILNSLSLGIHVSFKEKLRINSVAGNTSSSLFIAMIMVFSILVVSSIIGWIFGFASDIMTANSIAMIGAIPQFVLLNSPFLMFVIIVFFISTLETMVAIQVADLMLSSSKSNYTLKDKKVWVVSVLVGLGTVIYHNYAKFIPRTGELNIHALIIVFVLFTACILLAVHRKEMESSVYTHMGNNFLAMIYKLKDVLKAFGLNL